MAAVALAMNFAGEEVKAMAIKITTRTENDMLGFTHWRTDVHDTERNIHVHGLGWTSDESQERALEKYVEQRCDTNKKTQ